MNRFYLVIVAGLSSFTQIRAQEGALAPTVPVVPMPVVQNGSPMAPLTGNGSGGFGSGFRGIDVTKWSPFRNPVTAGAGVSDMLPAPPVEFPIVPLPPPQPVPLAFNRPRAACGFGGPCGLGGCASAHSGSCWGRFKAWLCFHQTPTELPKCRPAPYEVPLMGMFPCHAGCGGCAVLRVPRVAMVGTLPSLPPTPNARATAPAATATDVVTASHLAAYCPLGTGGLAR